MWGVHILNGMPNDSSSINHRQHRITKTIPTVFVDLQQTRKIRTAVAQMAVKKHQVPV
jgi:hypothetical protein